MRKIFSREFQDFGTHEDAVGPAIILERLFFEIEECLNKNNRISILYFANGQWKMCHHFNRIIKVSLQGNHPGRMPTDTVVHQ